MKGVKFSLAHFILVFVCLLVFAILYQRKRLFLSSCSYISSENWSG